MGIPYLEKWRSSNVSLVDVHFGGRSHTVEYNTLREPGHGFWVDQFRLVHVDASGEMAQNRRRSTRSSPGRRGTGAAGSGHRRWGCTLATWA